MGKFPGTTEQGILPPQVCSLGVGGLPGPCLPKQENVICVTSIMSPLPSLGLSFPICRVVPGAGSAPNGPDLRIPLGMEKPRDWVGPGTDFVSELPSYPAVQPRKRSPGLGDPSSLRSPQNSSLSLPLDSEVISQHHHHPNPGAREFPQLPSLSPALTSPQLPSSHVCTPPPSPLPVSL